MKQHPPFHRRIALRLWSGMVAVSVVMGLLMTGSVLLTGCWPSDEPLPPATSTRVLHPTAVSAIASPASYVAEAVDPPLPPAPTETWTPTATLTHLPTLTPTGTAARTPTQTLMPTLTRTPTSTVTRVPSRTPTRTAEPTATCTETATPKPTPAAATPTPRPSETPAPALAIAPGLAPHANHLGTEKVVLADYLLWYGPDVFDGTKTWDVPAAGPYNSDDVGTIRRHVAEAQQACLDGFAVHWYGPSDSRTTANFSQLLAVSAGTSLRHVAVIQTNIMPGATETTIAEAIRYLIAHWAQGPNYLRLGERPLILFTDMPRPWGSETAAIAGWGRIRSAVDPNHTMIWLAEGLTTAYNPLFDGLYVYRIDHRDYPQSWLKQPRWASNLRAVEQQGNLPLGGLYFADTIAAGFDDTRSVNAPVDLRSTAPHFARDRREGGYYADTFAVTAQTGGDLLLVKSFNEWLEGTEIEPGKTYGDLYLRLTCQYADSYRNRP